MGSGFGVWQPARPNIATPSSAFYPGSTSQNDTVTLRDSGEIVVIQNLLILGQNKWEPIKIRGSHRKSAIFPIVPRMTLKTLAWTC